MEEEIDMLLIGKGRSGANVFKAIRVADAKVVTLKFVEKNIFDVGILFVPSHTNLLRPVEAFYTENNHICVELPFMVGGSLRPIMRHIFTKGLDNQSVSTILWSVLNLLSYLHQEIGVIHGKISTGKIFFPDQGDVNLSYVPANPASQEGIKEDLRQVALVALELKCGKYSQPSGKAFMQFVQMCWEGLKSCSQLAKSEFFQKHMKKKKLDSNLVRKLLPIEDVFQLQTTEEDVHFPLRTFDMNTFTFTESTPNQVIPSVPVLTYAFSAPAPSQSNEPETQLSHVTITMPAINFTQPAPPTLYTQLKNNLDIIGAVIGILMLITTVVGTVHSIVKNL